MRKLSYVLMALAILMVASPVYAQGGNAAESANWAYPIAAGLAALGQGKVAAAVAESIARNPGARAGIQLALFIGLAFIESLVLFTFVMIFIRTKL